MAYKGGHARREELARLLGFKSYRGQLAFQRESAANRELVSRRRESLEQQGRLGKGARRISERKQREVGAAESRRRVFPEPDGRFVRTNRESELRAFFRIAARRDGRVTSATVSVSTPAGPREVELWSKGGMDASTAWATIAALIESGETRAAKAFLIDQIMNTGARSYLPADPTIDDLLLAQLAAEW